MMPGPAAATPVLPSASYTYDSALSSVPNKGVHHERGPLLSQPVANARHAVDRGPHGISARPDSSETGRGYTYDDRATPAQAAQSIGGAQVKPTMARGIASLPQRLPVAAEKGGLADDMVVVRGGTSDVPGPGEVFSGAYGQALEDAAAGVPHGQIRATTVGDIRSGGGTVEIKPELTRSGVLNPQHVDICLGSGSCPFGPLMPNPIPKALRIQ